LALHNPELTIATFDYANSAAQPPVGTIKVGRQLLPILRVEASASGIQMLEIDEPWPRPSFFGAEVG
jgi:hypothetical protein